MVKLLNISHFFVLANYQQKEILKHATILLVSGDNTYYAVQDYYLTIEKRNVNGRIEEVKSMSDHMPKEILDGISLVEILLNGIISDAPKSPLTLHVLLSLLAIKRSEECAIDEDVWLSPYYQLDRKKVMPFLKKYNQN